MTKPTKKKVVKAWAVFQNNGKIIQGQYFLYVFPTKAYALEYGLTQTHIKRVSISEVTK